MLFLIIWFGFGLIPVIICLNDDYYDKGITLKSFGLSLLLLFFGFFSFIICLIYILDKFGDNILLKAPEKKTIKSLEDEIDRYKDLLDKMEKIYNKDKLN